MIDQLNFSKEEIDDLRKSAEENLEYQFPILEKASQIIGEAILRNPNPFIARAQDLNVLKRETPTKTLMLLGADKRIGQTLKKEDFEIIS